METFVDGQLWLKPYPVHYAGADFEARMTVIALGNNLRRNAHATVEQARAVPLGWQA